MTAIVLAGGVSSRLGKNKAFLRIRDCTLIEIIVDKLKTLFENIIIVTNTCSDYEFLETRTVEDIIPHKGPLGGIYAGLISSSDIYNFVVACDLPALNLEFITYMYQQVEGYDLVIPRLDGHYEPLHAIYSKKCSFPIKRQIDNDNLKIIDVFSQLRVKEIIKQEVKRFDPDLRSFFNINTLEDFEKIKRVMKVN